MCWDNATVERVVREWQTLSDWVPWLVDRYMLDHRTIPPCWFRHGPLVDLLSALHDKWRFCHDPAADASLPIEWQRSLREFEPRLRDFTSRTGCSRDQHRDTTPMLRADDKRSMHQYIEDDVAHRRDLAVESSAVRRLAGSNNSS
jgi:hypothetical protein